MLLDRSSLSDSSRLYLWGRPVLKALHSSRVSRSIWGKELSVSHSFSKAPRRMFWLTPMVKQKAFGTRPDVQIPREKGSQAVWEGLGTGTCFYFPPIPAPLACSLPPTGISVVPNHIQSTELARLWRHCNHCNAKFIFPVTIQPKKSMAQCFKNLDKVLCNRSLKTNPEMAVLHF